MLNVDLYLIALHIEVLELVVHVYHMQAHQQLKHLNAQFYPTLQLVQEAHNQLILSQYLQRSRPGTTDNYFHRFDFWNLFEFALTVLSIDVSAADSRGSFSP